MEKSKREKRDGEEGGGGERSRDSSRIVHARGGKQGRAGVAEWGVLRRESERAASEGDSSSGGRGSRG